MGAQATSRQGPRSLSASPFTILRVWPGQGDQWCPRHSSQTTLGKEAIALPFKESSQKLLDISVYNSLARSSQTQLQGRLRNVFELWVAMCAELKVGASVSKGKGRNRKGQLCQPLVYQDFFYKGSGVPLNSLELDCCGGRGTSFSSERDGDPDPFILPFSPLSCKFYA